MRKIACVFSFKESSWVSCQKIVRNLHRSYDGVPGLDIRNFHYGTDTLEADIMELTTELHDYQPDAISILDHRPHPYHFLKYLIPKFTGKKPHIIFHVFGDFTLYYSDWHTLAKLLTGFPVTFVVASHRQKLLIDAFLPAGNRSVVMPFPVDPGEFYFDEKLRNQQREAWELGETDLAFTFTGRLSRQKRIHQLLPIFHRAVQNEGPRKLYLFLYGLPDHVGDTFLSIWDNENEYFRKIDRIYRALPLETQKRIRFMGSVSNRDLLPVYAGSDSLVNLSVHNDEDFGMSVAEAQLAGLPAILTDWGGLASFHHPDLPEATRFIDVRIGKMAKVFSKDQVTSTIGEFSRSPGIDRRELSRLAGKRFSIEAGTPTVTEILNNGGTPFTGFSEFHALVTNRMQLQKPVYLTKYQTIHPIYRRIYSAYVRNP